MKITYMQGSYYLLIVNLIYIYCEKFWEKCLNICLRLSFLSTNSFATSAKFMLSRIFLLTCTSTRACSRLFPVDLKYGFKHFKTKKDFVAFKKHLWLDKVKIPFLLHSLSCFTYYGASTLSRNLGNLGITLITE